jgi:hypothetical protein
MAKIPSPEETAREILRVFVSDFNLRPGGGLMAQNLRSEWIKHGQHNEDLSPGMEYAIRKGWMEVSPEGDSYKLTEAGYERTRQSVNCGLLL